MDPGEKLVRYRPKDPMIYRIRIGASNFGRARDGLFSIPERFAALADMNPNLERVPEPAK